MLKDPERVNAFLAQIEEAKEAGALGYMTRALVQATMPHSKQEASYFIRKNGGFMLSMSNPIYGLPYGSIPRLLMAWITTEAVQTKERELVLGESLSGWMRELGLVPTGGRWGSITRLKGQMQRLFACSISCSYDQGDMTTMKNLVPVKEARLWWNPQRPDDASLFNSTLLLDADFFDEVVSSPVVFRLEALKALKQSSMAVDVYIWTTYRNSYIKRPTKIPWEALQLQFGAGYPMTVQGRANFRRKFMEALAKVALVYPDAGKLRPETEGLLFVPGRPHVDRLVIPRNGG